MNLPLMKADWKGLMVRCAMGDSLVAMPFAGIFAKLLIKAIGLN